jgi:hypothetical protein
MTMMNSVRNRKTPGLTPEERMAAEVAEYEKNGRVLDAPGLNEMITLTPLGDPRNAPTDARGKMSHRERADFIASNPDRPTTAEAMKAARLRQEAEHYSKKFQKWFVDCVTAKKNIQHEWHRLGNSGTCPFLQHFYTADLVENETSPHTVSAIRIFADSETFVPWRELNRDNKERFDLQTKTLDIVGEFIFTNNLDARRHDTWASRSHY